MDAHEMLDDLGARLNRAWRVITNMANAEEDWSEEMRLRAKAEGVQLAHSYLMETIRDLGPEF